MRYWLDTEFIEDGKTIDLISIGVVAGDGREYYAQNAGARFSRANAWVKANVLPQLQSCPASHLEMWHQDAPPALSCLPSCPWLSRADMARRLREFVDPEQHGNPEFWGYYADYDWVAVCQLFGTMMDLPTGWPMYCRDLKQWADDLGNPQLPEQGKGEHHALADARWNRQAWEFLRDIDAKALQARLAMRA